MMKVYSVHKARHSLDQLLKEVNEDVNLALITCKRGNGVLISERMWNELNYGVRGQIGNNSDVEE